MRIIAIEGLDKAGKHTATTVLESYFLIEGFNVKRESMPNYNSPIGKLIRDWLTGEFVADVKTFELLQAADKQHMQMIIENHAKEGVDILLMDRYVHSMLAYGAYDNNIEWLYELMKYMKWPNDVIYLDVEPEVSMHRRGKFGDNDLYESDIERLRATKETYLQILADEKAIGKIDNLYHINANEPELMVKAKIFEVAKQMYNPSTGEKQIKKSG